MAIMIPQINTKANGFIISKHQLTSKKSMPKRIRVSIKFVMLKSDEPVFEGCISFNLV